MSAGIEVMYWMFAMPAELESELLDMKMQMSDNCYLCY